ncbi:hypothetical protein D3C84_952890 [compost metagenome]
MEVLKVVSAGLQLLNHIPIDLDLKSLKALSYRHYIDRGIPEFAHRSPVNTSISVWMGHNLRRIED